MSLRIDLAWMMRTGHAREGSIMRSSLHWSRGGQPSGSISYTAYMEEPGNERLELSYTRGKEPDRENVSQTVRLCHTTPNYGGKRWWMVCPFRGIRVGKLYLPSGGDRFASRQAWRLGYRSQRETQYDRAVARLHAQRRKLGCEPDISEPLWKPKGMWQRTFDRHVERYRELDLECSQSMLAAMAKLIR